MFSFIIWFKSAAYMNKLFDHKTCIWFNVICHVLEFEFVMSLYFHVHYTSMGFKLIHFS